MASKGCKICSIVSAVILIIVVTVIVTLSLTIFKVKDPIVSVHPVDLDKMDFFSPNSATVPLKMVITIVNPNYGAFEAMDATGYLKYRDNVVANIPLAKRTIPARSTVNVSATADLNSQKLIDDERFLTDLEDESYNMTSTALLPGKVHMLISLKATVNIFCDIAFNTSTMTTKSSCIAKIKL